ncbi:MAG: twin-arginine translocation signal domain-containing protein, partial [Verrucomicrobiota bacterium]|nr:twin-arginine translocation signal domain-containing protein [Verrucomicrobiota bacterium]
MEAQHPSAQSSRRRFLQGAAATGALGFPAIVNAKSPNSKLDVAVIGCGGRGGHNLRTVGNTENIVALVDVNDRNLRGAAS